MSKAYKTYFPIFSLLALQIIRLKSSLSLNAAISKLIKSNPGKMSRVQKKA